MKLVNAQVQNQVWFQISKRVRGSQVWDLARSGVHIRVRNQVNIQVRDQVRIQVDDQVWNQVRRQVDDQVWNQVRRASL